MSVKNNLNNSQREAVRHMDGPMLVLAGPGSGKTAVITLRTVNLIEKGIPGDHILVITFTRAAAGEMRDRFEKLRGKGDRVTFGTFHSIFFGILKNAYHYRSENIISAAKRTAFLKECMETAGLDGDDQADLMEELIGEIGRVKNEELPLDHYYAKCCSTDQFRRVFREYEKKLQKNHLIDFDDMMTYTKELLTQRPDILAAWQERFSYILVDEFQDINPIQYKIMLLLAGKKKNIFVVGDDDQSIYRFRGAKPDLMFQFEKDFPQAKRVLLNINYRCGGYITEAAANLIGHNQNRFAKDIESAGITKNPIRFMTFEGRSDQNRFLIDEIRRQKDMGTDYEKIAVLFRTNLEARQLTELFMKDQIPFRIREKMPGLYDHWIARDLMTYISLGEGSRKRQDFLLIMNRPKRYLSRDSLPGERVDLDRWESSYQTQPWIAERIEKLACDLDMIGRMSPYSAVNYIRRGVGYDDFLLEYAGERNIDSKELFDILEEVQEGARSYKTFDDWRQHISEYKEKMRQLADQRAFMPHAVTLATLHGAKGLEFDQVFLINANEGCLPYKKAVLPEEIEEERRLFYVGMTRAKHGLTICSAKNDRGKTLEISRFVREAQQH